MTVDNSGDKSPRLAVTSAGKLSTNSLVTIAVVRGPMDVFDLFQACDLIVGRWERPCALRVNIERIEVES